MVHQLGEDWAKSTSSLLGVRCCCSPGQEGVKQSGVWCRGHFFKNLSVIALLGEGLLLNEAAL